jgi:hypothetical protein
MKALIQKDLRENLKVALIGLLIFSLLVIGAYLASAKALTSLLAGTGWQPGVLQPLLSPLLLSETAFFCAVFGVALGWVQARNEAHRDLWAFLVHRPVTRTEIFWGKSIAGLCLYVLGAGVPLAILVAVVRTPGRVAAPFEWAMVLPLAANFLTGVAYYFAGLLTGLRQARWYASRSFGLAVAIAASVAVISLTEFWQMLILIAIAVVILATAVWGAYQSGGYFQGQPVTGRLALIVAMTAGCGGALFAGVGLLLTLVLAPLLQTSFEFSNYQMARDGTIYRLTYRDNGAVEIVDLNGHPLLDPKTGQKMERNEFQKLRAESGTVSNNPKYRRNRINFRDCGRFFELLKVADKTLWYLDRHGKLAGYDGGTRKYIGRLNPHSNDGSLTSEPFLEGNNYNFYNHESQAVMATAKSVYQVDFKSRTTKAVFTLTNDDDEIGGYGVLGISGDHIPTSYLLLTTRKTVRLFDSEVRPISAAPYRPGYFEYPTVSVMFLQPTNSSTTNFAVWFHPDDEMNSKSGWKMPDHVVWLGADYAVLKSVDLPTVRPHVDKSWLEKLAMTLLPPPAHVEFDENIYSPWNVFSFAFAVTCAVIGCLLARRYNFSITAIAGWTLFIFLLGIAGLLGLLCVEEWPARESCPKCKKLRAVDREYCEHCGSPFSPPEKNGTEIFGPLAKV